MTQADSASFGCFERCCERPAAPRRDGGSPSSPSPGLPGLDSIVRSIRFPLRANERTRWALLALPQWVLWARARGPSPQHRSVPGTPRPGILTPADARRLGFGRASPPGTERPQDGLIARSRTRGHSEARP